jgi:hypothetical protein
MCFGILYTLQRTTIELGRQGVADPEVADTGPDSMTTRRPVHLSMLIQMP